MNAQPAKRIVALGLVGGLIFAGWLLLRPSGLLPLREGSVERAEATIETNRVTFPTYKSNAYMQALLEASTLVLHDGCLFAGLGSREVLLVWPEGSRFEDGRVLSRSGREVARVGDPFRSGGGFIEPKDAEKLIGKSVPGACLTPGETVWLVGEI